VAVTSRYRLTKGYDPSSLANAVAECWVGMVRRECLDKLLMRCVQWLLVGCAAATSSVD
jgi:hypothetical protein